MPKRILIAFIILLFSSFAQAEVISLKGSLYLYNPDGKTPLPLSGYMVSLYNIRSKKFLNQSVTDSYGRYAFYGVSEGEYLLRVYMTGSHWQQQVWQQKVQAPSVIQSIVLPPLVRVEPNATYEEIKDLKDTYNFKLWVDVPQDKKGDISKVVYYFNHSSFKPDFER